MSNIILLIVFFLSPLISLPFVLKKIIANEKFSYFILSLLFACLSYLMVPYETMDLAGHYSRYDALSTCSLIDYKINDRYFTLDYVILIMQLLGFNKQFLPFFYILSTYSLTLYTIYGVKKLHNSFNAKPNFNTKVLLCFFIFFMLSQMRLIPYASGLRSALANAFILFGAYNLFIRNNKAIGSFFILFSPLIHISTIVYTPIMFLVMLKTLQFHKVSRALFLVGLVILFTNSGQSLMYLILKGVDPFISNDFVFLFDIYTTGHWGAGFKDNVSLFEYLYELVIKPAPIYVLALYFYLVKVRSRFRDFIYLLFFIVSFIVGFRTLVDRYGDLLCQISLLCMFYEYHIIKYSHSRKIIIYLLAIVYIGVDVSGARVFREVIYPSWERAVYSPIIFYPIYSVEESQYLKSK